jgi:hypothetical protein
VLVDDKPLGSLDFDVVPAAAPLKLKSPVELWGSLANGTQWSDEVRALYEPVPGVRLEFPGITEADPEPGWLRGTQTASVVASDSAGARIDTYRAGKLFSSAWMLVTDKGIAASKTVTGGDTSEAGPPELVIASPAAAFQQSWRWHSKGQKPEFDRLHEMWGPLTVKTPNGEAQGYVLLEKIPDSDDPSLVATSIESRIVPGLGTVYAATVVPIPQFHTAVHIEARLHAMKPGSGPEPETRKLPDN